MRFTNIISKFKKQQLQDSENQYISAYAKRSYSQCGEDLIMQYIFRLRNIYSPTFIDIGANDPYFLNNTAIFYELGSRGLNIEANPDLMKNLNELRPDDLNLNVGIGSMEDEIDFYRMSDPTLSTFIRQECDKYISTGRYQLIDTVKVNVTTITNLVNQYFDGMYPDLLTIDTEGMDLDILRTMSFGKNSPKVICVEAAEYSPIGAGKARREIVDFLRDNGYFEYANTNLNAIMVRCDFWFV